MSSDLEISEIREKIEAIDSSFVYSSELEEATIAEAAKEEPMTDNERRGVEAVHDTFGDEGMDTFLGYGMQARKEMSSD